MADELIIFGMVAISCFLMGLVVSTIFLQKRHTVNNRMPQKEIDAKPIPPPIATPSQPSLMTVCHKCKRKYSFYKNQMGKTKVECPYCHAKGIIG